MRLMLAAEQMMARHGINGVSLRSINEQAGLKNVSAIHYHFGSKEKLILEIIGFRFSQINSIRLNLMASIREIFEDANLHEAVRALVVPMASAISEPNEKSFYIRFSERVARELDGMNFLAKIDPKLFSGWVAAAKVVDNHLLFLPSTIREARMGLLRNQIVSGLASVEEDLDRGRLQRTQVQGRIELLIDAVSGMLIGPASRSTIEFFPVNMVADPSRVNQIA